MHSFVLAALLLFQPNAPAPSVKDLAWLSGRWTGTLGRATIEESWTDTQGGAMLATSRTIVGERLVMFEYLRIIAKPDGLYYVAQPNGRPPVEFKLTKSGPGLAVFSNPLHDHPKTITYQIDASQTLTATIEGEEKGQPKKQEFRFRKQTP